MRTTYDHATPVSVAARIAGEDLQPGDFIATLFEMVEFPSFLWDSTGATLPADEVVRLKFQPRHEGRPLKVLAVCLPFVYTKDPQGQVVCIDSRQQALVRIDPTSGKRVWKALKQLTKKKRK